MEKFRKLFATTAHLIAAVIFSLLLTLSSHAVQNKQKRPVQKTPEQYEAEGEKTRAEIKALEQKLGKPTEAEVLEHMRRFDEGQEQDRLRAIEKKKKHKTIPGHELKFDFTGHMKERKIAYEWYKEKYGEGDHCSNGAAKADKMKEKIKEVGIQEFYSKFSNGVLFCGTLHIDLIGVAMYDLDDDGEEEIIVFNKGLGVIRSGYMILGFKRIVDENGVESYKCFDVATDGEINIKILSAKTEGMHDIVCNGFMLAWSKEYGSYRYGNNFD